jgi:hypothetical protein
MICTCCRCIKRVEKREHLLCSLEDTTHSTARDRHPAPHPPMSRRQAIPPHLHHRLCAERRSIGVESVRVGRSVEGVERVGEDPFITSARSKDRQKIHMAVFRGRTLHVDTSW